MAKLNLSDLGTLTNEAAALATMSANNTATEVAIENTLSRNGASPNQMDALLDMNSHRIINLPSPVGPTDPVRLGDVNLSTVVVTKSLPFSSVASAAAASIGISVDIIETLGYASPGDNGGAYYARIAATTPAVWRFQSADGQWWSLNSRTVTPEMFGASSGVNSTAAFVALGTWLASLAGGAFVGSGGIIVNFTANADYLLWPNGTPPAAACVLENVKGVTFNFNGARFSTNNDFTLGNAAVFYMRHAGGLTFNGPAYACTNPTVTGGSISPDKFGIFFYIEETTAPWTTNIQINNATQSWGSAFLSVTGDVTGSVSRQAHNISVINADLNSVFYGLNFQGSGDNVFARGIKATNCGRIYFPFNVSNHDVEVFKNGGGNSFVSVILKALAYPNGNETRRSLSNIKVKFFCDSPTAASTDGVMVGLDMQQTVPQVNVSGAVNNGAGLLRLTVNTTADMATGQRWYVNSVGGITNINDVSYLVTVIDGTHLDLQASTGFGGAYTTGGYMRVPASLRDIDIQVEGTLTSLQPSAICTYKENSDGTPDLTTSGYTVENVTISGSLKNFNYGIPAISLFLNNGYSNGTWVGERIRNITLRDLTVTGTNTSVLIDATGVQANLALENIWSTPTTVTWTLTGTGTNTRMMNVSGTGLTDKQAVIPSTAGANQYATGVSTLGAVTYANASGLTTAPGNLTGAITSVGLATVLGSFSSADLRSALTDETGTGVAVFATSPTLTTPVIASIVNTGTLTLPTSTDTLIGKATTDVLTNKTFNSAGTGNVLQVSGVTVARGQYPGTSTNDSATSGNIGEYVESVVLIGSAVSETTATPMTVTSISLTAGDWDISGLLYHVCGATTSTTRYLGSLSLATASIDAAPGRFHDINQAATVVGALTYSNPIPRARFSLSATTTVYLVSYSVFTVSTMAAYGIICARRVR